jgi:hypothetical protein
MRPVAVIGCAGRLIPARSITLTMTVTWMLFAFDAAGTPSVAATITVPAG